MQRTDLSRFEVDLDVELTCACAGGDPAIHRLLVEARCELEAAKEQVVAHVAAVLSWDGRGRSKVCRESNFRCTRHIAARSWRSEPCFEIEMGPRPLTRPPCTSRQGWPCLLLEHLRGLRSCRTVWRGTRCGIRSSAVNVEGRGRLDALRERHREDTRTASVEQTRGFCGLSPGGGRSC